MSIQIMPSCGRIEEHLRFAGEGYCVDVWTGTSHPWRVAGYLDGELVLDARAPAAQPPHVRGGSGAETEAFIQAVLNGAPLPGPSVPDALASAEVAARMDQAKGHH